MTRLIQKRRGVTALLAMLYLVLFSALAIGFYTSTRTTMTVTENEEKINDLLTASESGLQFMRFQMHSMNLNYGTTQSNLMANTATALGALLNGTPNMNGNTVTVSGGQINIPSATSWINLDPSGATKFRATITQVPASTILQVTVRAADKSSNITRAVRMNFQPNSKSYALMGINSVTMSGAAYTDSYDSTKGPYNAATATPDGTIISNGNITLLNTARVKGDARPGPGRTVNVAATASVTGSKAPLGSPIAYPSVVLPAGVTSIGDVNHSSGVLNYPGGTYLINNLTLSGTVVVNWQGPVTLYIRNSYNVSGNVVINTYQNLPKNRKLNFLPTCVNATWTGTNTCVGELYAPDTNFTVSGSVTKLGRITARTITNSSSGGMHADRSLPLPGGSGNYEPLQDTYEEVN